MAINGVVKQEKCKEEWDEAEILFGARPVTPTFVKALLIADFEDDKLEAKQQEGKKMPTERKKRLQIPSPQ